MTRKYTPRRAGHRWNHDAPEWVLDCFYHPQFADCYTVWFGKADCFHVKRNGSIGQGPDQYHNTWVRGIGTSEYGGTSGALEYSAHDVAMSRYHSKHHRIAWRDLPDATRALVTRFYEESTQ